MIRFAVALAAMVLATALTDNCATASPTRTEVAQ